MEAARAKDVRDGGHVLIPVYTSVKCAIKIHFEPVHCRELGETRASDVLVLFTKGKMRTQRAYACAWENDPVGERNPQC